MYLIQKDKQRSTKHTYKTKDRVTRTPLKTGGELRCSGRVSSSCSTSGTHNVNLVTNPVISREWGKDFPIVNFPFICSNIPAAPAYGVYISQMLRYSRACGFYQDFLDRGLHLKVWSRPICICGILYFKLNGIDAINKITKPRII
jgi:hypothetical protein